jgi:hypothetical protein
VIAVSAIPLRSQRVGENVRVGGQCPKALVNDLLLTAERTYLAIVACLDMEPILHNGRLDP